MNELLQGISSVGFPIVACVAMFVQINKTNELHKQESDRMSDAINNNTLVVQKLLDRLEGRE